jgi:hypothetical protein
MNRVKWLVFGLVAIWALTSFGFIPPDFKYREKEYIQKRQRDVAEYEQREIEYKKSLVNQRVRVEVAMKKPLWEDTVQHIVPDRVGEKVPAKKENRVVQRTEQALPEKATESAVVPAQVVTNKFIQKPPRKKVAEDKSERVVNELPLVEEKEGKLSNRFLVSIVLLILIGFAAGWAWYKTRKIDE